MNYYMDMVFVEASPVHFVLFYVNIIFEKYSIIMTIIINNITYVMRCVMFIS